MDSTAPLTTSPGPEIQESGVSGFNPASALACASGVKPSHFADSRQIAVVGIEGNCMAGKSTLVKGVQALLETHGCQGIVVPEYVDYLPAKHLLFKRPLLSQAEQRSEGEFYLRLERMRQADIRRALQSPERRSGQVILMDRTFFTCLAYAELSGNPVSRRMFAEYLSSAHFVHPDLILFLSIPPNAPEYLARREARRQKSPNCLGLNTKIQEYSYIYQARDYEGFFRVVVSEMHPNLKFVNSLGFTPEKCVKVLLEKKLLPRRSCHD